MKHVLLFVAFVSILYFTAFSQSNYTLTNANNIIKGTSSLHSWQCVVKKQTGTATIYNTGTLAISALTVNMESASIKSINEDGSSFNESMDKNIYKALKTDQFANITYKLISTSNVKTKGNTTSLTATGELTIAGKTNKILFPVKAVVNGNKIIFSGATKFKMSLFGIKPPTALMGTIKTGDEITIVLNSTFTKQ
ncbi:MAG: YceI family protein [Niabella sp.]